MKYLPTMLVCSFGISYILAAQNQPVDTTSSPIFVNITGNGSAITSLNATQLTTGTIPSGRESTNTALLNGTQTFSGNDTFSQAVNFNSGVNTKFQINPAGSPNITFTSGAFFTWQTSATTLNGVNGAYFNSPSFGIMQIGTNLNVQLNVIAGGTMNPTNGLIVGNATNTVSFTLVNTNWISGQLYTNLTGRPIMVIMPCQITMTGVSGNATYAVVTATTTNALSMSTLITSLATSMTNQVSAFVAAGGTFTGTNLSSGTGDSSGPVNGGQYMVY